MQFYFSEQNGKDLRIMLTYIAIAIASIHFLLISSVLAANVYAFVFCFSTNRNICAHWKTKITYESVWKYCEVYRTLALTFSLTTTVRSYNMIQSVCSA